MHFGALYRRITVNSVHNGILDLIKYMLKMTFENLTTVNIPPPLHVRDTRRPAQLALFFF